MNVTTTSPASPPRTGWVETTREGCCHLHITGMRGTVFFATEREARDAAAKAGVVLRN